jgi:hypothetical protein
MVNAEFQYRKEKRAIHTNEKCAGKVLSPTQEPYLLYSWGQ